MNTHILPNGLKLIYNNGISNLSSVCISIDGGAIRDDGLLGIAHATEHIIYKGTINRSEDDINRELTRLFPFQNAMTNYPYVIYYGSLLEEDLEKGLEIFSDILVNPLINDTGFIEEMKVIKEELNEWNEELEQFCEDRLLLNGFNHRRIKYPIIGKIETLENITIEAIRNFYKKYYIPNNTVIAVSSKLDFTSVVKMIYKYFENWTSDIVPEKIIIKENLSKGFNISYRPGINSAKVKIAYDISLLTAKEIQCLILFNEYFGGSVDSILFDLLRTKNGLVYDVNSKISLEEHIKLFVVTFTTSNSNIDKALELYKELLITLFNKRDININNLVRSVRGKKYFKEEQSIQLVKALATYVTMFGEFEAYNNETKELEEITPEEIKEVIKKTLINERIQIVRNTDE